MHESGCPCNGWAGCYAKCECDAIRQRNHTEALNRHAEELRQQRLEPAQYCSHCGKPIND